MALCETCRVQFEYTESASCQACVNRDFQARVLSALADAKHAIDLAKEQLARNKEENTSEWRERVWPLEKHTVLAAIDKALKAIKEL